MAVAAAFGEWGRLGNTLPRQLVFAWFTGEAYSYMGSRRLVHDLANYSCQDSSDSTESSEAASSCELPYMPSLAFRQLAWDKVVSVIGVGSLAGSATYLHYDPNLAPSNLPSRLAEVSPALPTNTQLAAPVAGELPPSPVHSFLLQNPSLRACVLTDYESTFRDSFYHSQFDTAESMSFSFRSATKF